MTPGGGDECGNAGVIAKLTTYTETLENQSSPTFPSPDFYAFQVCHWNQVTPNDEFSIFNISCMT